MATPLARTEFSEITVANDDWGIRGSNSRVARYALENGALDRIDEDQFYSELSLGPHTRIVSVDKLVHFHPPKNINDRLDIYILALTPLEIMAGMVSGEQAQSHSSHMGLFPNKFFVSSPSRVVPVLEVQQTFPDLCASMNLGEVISTLERPGHNCALDRKLLRAMRWLRRGEEKTTDARTLLPLMMQYQCLAPGEWICVDSKEPYSFVCGEALVLHGTSCAFHQGTRFGDLGINCTQVGKLFEGTCCYPGRHMELNAILPNGTISLVLEGKGLIDGTTNCRAGQCFFHQQKALDITVPLSCRGPLKVISIAHP